MKWLGTQPSVQYLENDSADEFNTLDDGVLGSRYRHASLGGVGQKVTSDLYLCPGGLLSEKIHRSFIHLLYKRNYTGHLSALQEKLHRSFICFTREKQMA